MACASAALDAQYRLSLVLPLPILNTREKARRDMASFPSFWIIEAEESRSAPRPRSSPSPTGRATTPRRRREGSFTSLCNPLASPQPCNHDDVFPSQFRGRRTYAPCSHDIFAPQLSPLTTHPLSREVWAATMTPPPPQQGTSGRYSTHFPSSWLLQAQNGANSMTTFGHIPATRVETLRPSAPVTPLSPVTPPSATSIPTSALRPELPIRTPIYASTEHERTGIQDSFIHEADAFPEITRVRDDVLSELKGEPTYPNKEEEIGIWVQSLDHTTRVCASGNVPSSVDNRLCSAGEKHPSSFDNETDLSDASGLGDAPHVTQEVPDTYSIYSTSTYLRNKAVRST